MPFNAGDRSRIVYRLQLRKDQDTTDSLLQELMTEAERFDTDNTTTYVAQIQQSLDNLDALGLQSDAIQEDPASYISSYRIDYHYSVGQITPAVAANAVDRKIAGEVRTIWRLLDNNKLLRGHVAVGRITT